MVKLVEYCYYTFQLLYVLELYAYFPASLFGACQLYRCLEELCKVLLELMIYGILLLYGTLVLLYGRRCAAFLDAPYNLFDFAYRVAVLLYFVENVYLVGMRVKREQGFCMSHVNLLLLKGYLYCCRQFKKAQEVGYCCTSFADTFAQLLLRKVMLLDELLVCKCNFQWIQVFALNVFRECPRA